MKRCKILIGLSLLVFSVILLSGCEKSPEASVPETVLESASSSDTVPKQSPASVYAKDALHKAANRGDLEEVKAILASGVDTDARDSYGGTALHAAMFQDNMEIVRLLIDYGFDVNAQGSSNGYTPLHDAVWGGNQRAAKLLIESGADPTIKNGDGQTPEEKAKAEGKTELYEYLSQVNRDRTNSRS